MLTAYPQPGKDKALRVCEAFIVGARQAGVAADICTTIPNRLRAGAAVFYGVRPAWAHLWEQAKSEVREWWFIDNAYFDGTRERCFRVTRNAIQHNGAGRSNGKRFEALGVFVRPMCQLGQVVVACAQSDEFMRVVAGAPDWLSSVVQAKRAAGLQVLVRHKGEQRPLAEDLKRARLVLTWSSAAAVGALLEGVPVECAPQCCAYGVAGADRSRWASVLADNQWSLREMERGITWKALHGQVAHAA